MPDAPVSNPAISATAIATKNTFATKIPRATEDENQQQQHEQRSDHAGLAFCMRPVKQFFPSRGRFKVDNSIAFK